MVSWSKVLDCAEFRKKIVSDLLGYFGEIMRN